MSTAKITYLGHSALCLTTSQGMQILIDPFLTGNRLCPDPDMTFTNLQAICLTHGHADHVGDTVRLAKQYGCKVCSTFELATLLLKEGVPASNLEYMNKGGSVLVDDLKVTLSQAFHSNSFDASDGQTYYAGEACSIVLQIQNGSTIFHAGDTMLFSDLRLIGEIYSPDIALLPIGDRFTMGPDDAARAAKMLGAKTVIPIHYATFDALSGTPEEFKHALKGSEIEVVALEPGVDLSI